MTSKIDRPYVLRVAELIYSKIIEIKNQNPEINNIQAFEIFMTTKDYDFISSGEFHENWISELKKNNFIDNITGKKINEETLRLLEIQKESMIKFLLKMKCKKIILGCTELPIAIFAFKSFKNIKSSKTFLDPNLILAHSAMQKHKR